MSERERLLLSLGFGALGLGVLGAAWYFFGELGFDAIRYLAGVVAVALAAGMWLRERMLRGPLKRLAKAHGWSYDATSPGACDGLSGYPFLSAAGAGATATSVVRGTVRGAGFTAFNYQTRQQGKLHALTMNHFSIVALDAPLWCAPVEVLATGGRERVLAASLVQFESDDFNQRYRVSSEDPRTASAILHPRTLELLIANHPIFFRLGAGKIVAWATGRLEPDEVLRWSDTLHRVLEAIPDFVHKDHERGPAVGFSAPSPTAEAVGFSGPGAAAEAEGVSEAVLPRGALWDSLDSKPLPPQE